MTVEKKLQILGDSAKYDVSCVSSGSTRSANSQGLGNTLKSGICHSWTSDGRCVSLLKILYSNACVYDCAYCINRRGNSRPRLTFTVEEIVNLTINFYKRNYIEGLFLSSGIIGSPDYTMERLYLVAKRLRKEENFNGYIHLKAIPGASPELLRKAGLFADRLSCNIELPTEQSLSCLAPQKTKGAIFGAMGYLDHSIRENREDKLKLNHTPEYVPAGQSTQLIVGATPENDYQILSLTANLYQRYNLRRVYYSAYVPVNQDTRLQPLPTPQLNREHRLYQADWLLRFYQFKVHEILEQEHGYLDETLDPKTAWALRHLDFFPVEINKADYEALLRIPGIGVQSARKILRTRRATTLNFDVLQKMNIVMKRARYFITCNGKYHDYMHLSPNDIKTRFLTQEEPYAQGELFA